MPRSKKNKQFKNTMKMNDTINELGRHLFTSSRVS